VGGLARGEVSGVGRNLLAFGNPQASTDPRVIASLPEGEYAASTSAPSVSASRSPSHNYSFAALCGGNRDLAGADPRAADRQALALKAALERLSGPLAREAAALVEAKSWNNFGYARLDDHARERFGRSGRWVRDLACLGRGLDALPGLEGAVSGDDGRRPTGLVAAIWIARQASSESAAAWIDQARVLTARELREELRAAREAGSDSPLRQTLNQRGSHDTNSSTLMGDMAHDDDEIDATRAMDDESEASVPAQTDDAADAKTEAIDTQERAMVRKSVVTPEVTTEWRVVRLGTPQAVKVAFDETLDLYRAVEGREESTTSFVEALVAEASSGLQAPVIELDFVVPGRSRLSMEDALAKITGNWSHLDGVRGVASASAETGLQTSAEVAIHAHAESAPQACAETILQVDLETAAGAVEGVEAGARVGSTAGAGAAAGAGAVAGVEVGVDASARAGAASPFPLPAAEGADPNTFLGWLLQAVAPFPLPAPEGTDPDARIRWLLQIEERLERRLGELLARMDDAGAWRGLRFAGLGHYAEQRLGLSRSTAHERARLARALRRLDVIRQAYEAGRIGLAAALCLVRILGDGPVDDALQREWVERAATATVKRLKDEARALQRRQVAERFPPSGHDESANSPSSSTGDQQAERFPSSNGDGAAEQFPSSCHDEPAECSPPATGDGPAQRCLSSNGNEMGEVSEGRDPERRKRPRPLSGAEWHASLRREVGTTRKRVWNLGRSALSEAGSEAMLRMSLPEDLAQSFLGVVEATRRLLATQGQINHTKPEDDEAPSLSAARTFSTRGQAVPAWVGLLALLEEFVETWDVRQGERRPSENAVHIRDGWRCMAPGCTSRRNLQEHHIRYRSQGGSDDLWNRVCLCEFHHLRGEHGELASCRGEAPLNIEWSLGLGGRGGLFRNELAMHVLLKRQSHLRYNPAMIRATVDIDELSSEERLNLIERLWESLKEDPQGVPLTAPQRAELDRRLDELDREGASGIPWEEVARQICRKTK